MSEQEKLTVGGLVTILLLFTPSFVLHAAPRFPGSLMGSLLGIAAAGLMLLLLAYPLIRRCPKLRQRVSAWFPVRVLLSFHVYVGALGAVLGILHTGHKFESPLGITLVVAMLVATLSGFTGRYYLAHLTVELRDQKTALDLMRAEYDRIATAIPVPAVALADGGEPARSTRVVIAAIADLEYSLRRHETIKRAFAVWMAVHIGAALILYPALLLHIWNALYFGLRWL